MFKTDSTRIRSKTINLIEKNFKVQFYK